jgi:DNA-binding NarL/FixJ family response regulator
VVEDNRTFRETLELLFGMNDGIEIVLSVATGDEAAQACVEHEPDVVLMDYRMPGLNGADATRAVLAACPETKVVCLTASVAQEEMRDLYDAGAVACLTKDAGFDEILAAVRGAAAWT